MENNTFERIDIDSTTIDEERFNVFGFIDGSVTETLTLGMGPNGDYHHTMRKDFHDLTQMLFYSGYKNIHGLTNLDIMLPTGIHYIYGPCSVR